MVLSEAEKEEVLKEVYYEQHPEEFKQGVYAIQDFLHVNDMFHGKFRNGIIDGIYFSNGLVDARKMYGIVKIKGTYDLTAGTIQLKITKSNFYYFIFSALFLFGIGSSIMIFRDDQVPNMIALFPWSIVLLNYIIYFFAYRSREKEIIHNFEHFLGLKEDLLG